MHSVQDLKIGLFSLLICNWFKIPVILGPGILSDKIMSVQNTQSSFNQI